MRDSASTFRARPWRIHELTHDFRVEDVWRPDISGGLDDLAALVEVMTSSDPRDGSLLARGLWALRRKLGEWLHWDRESSGLGGRVPSLRSRLPADLRAAPATSAPRGVPFAPVYLLRDEWAAEIANETVHGVIHVGWVHDETGGGCHAELTVLVKPNGRLGRLYMAAIAPFRHLVIYPQMLARLRRDWQARPVVAS